MADSTPRPMTLKEIVETKRSSRDNDRPGSDAESRNDFEWLGWPGRIAILLAVVIAPWMMGSVYYEGRFILAVLIAVATGSWWLVLTLNTGRLSAMPWIGFLLFGGILLGLLQLTPLSEGVAGWVTGRQGEIFREWSAPGIVGYPAATTISLDRESTWNQVLLLILCLAGLASTHGLFRRQRELLLLWGTCCVNGTALAFFGIIYKFTANGKIFWQIESVFQGQPFASFVNRNNGAGFLLLTLAATVGLINYLWISNSSRGPELLISREIPVWRQFGTWLQVMLSELTATKLATLLAAVLIAAAVMSSLSRGGVIALLGGAMATMLYYGMARRPQIGALMIFPLIGAVICLTMWIGFYDDLMARFGERGGGLNDLTAEEGRLKSWSVTVPSFLSLGWIGGGLGIYPALHRMYSEVNETGLYEYAENQFVQALLDGGVVAEVLLLLAVGLAFYYATFLLYRGSSGLTVATGTFGVFLVSSQVLASMFDFGWYIPANALVLSVMTGAIAFQSHSLAGRLKKKNLLRLEIPAWAGKVVALLLFAGVVLSAVAWHRYWKWDSQTIARVGQLPPGELDLEATKQHIDEMGRLKRNLGISRASEARYMGELWMRMTRLQYYATLLDQTPVKSLGAANREKVEAGLW